MHLINQVFISEADVSKNTENFFFRYIRLSLVDKFVSKQLAFEWGQDATPYLPTDFFMQTSHCPEVDNKWNYDKGNFQIRFRS